MTLCPGKRQPHAVTGPWDRDLQADLGAIKKFDAVLLITLMQADELLAAGLSLDVMAAAAATCGLNWLHLSIADFRAPDAHFESLWRSAHKRVHDILKNGQNIVAHCRGGRGRSGMFAALILTEFGLSATDAIGAVRAVNPLAMETADQEAYVRARASLPTR